MHTKVIHFWFEEIDSSSWFKKDPDFDSELTKRFAELHARAAACELHAWRSCALGSLAEVIVLDQFSRNMYRGQAKAFACDSLALALAQTAVAKGFDLQLTELQRSFLYMPYMHSESAVIHEQAVKLYTKLGREENLRFEYKHKQIIDTFGRYPHRNAALGRASTAEELEFLKRPDSGF